MRFLRGFYYSPDNGGSGGGSGGGDDNGGGQSGDGLERRLEQAFANLANRQGGQDAAGVLLLQENRDYREQIRQLEQQVEALQGQVPDDDAVVLEGDEATRWQSYQELGEPDELRQQREQYQTLQRRQTLTEAAAAAGYKVPVLERLAGDLTVELREEQVDGKAVKVPYVKADEEGDATPLADYAKEQWGDFLPALQAEESSGGGRTFINQTPAGGGTSKDRVEKFLEQKREREAEQKSPLDP